MSKMTTAPKGKDFGHKEMLPLYQIFLLFLFNGTCSVCMMLLNKHLSLIFPYPFLTIGIQNGLVVFFSMLFMYGLGEDKPKEWKLEYFKKVVPVGMATVGVLSCSIIALRHSPLPLIVTFRNLAPIVCAFLDFCVFRKGFPPSAIAGLVCSLFGSMVYTYFDNAKREDKSNYSGYQESTGGIFDGSNLLSAKNFGLLFIISNLCLSALIIVMEMVVMGDIKKAMPPTAANVCRITVMYPVLIAMSYATEDPSEYLGVLSKSMDNIDLTNPMSLKGSVLLYLFVSGFFAFGFGVTNLKIACSGVRPTTSSFANTTYKLATTVAAHFMFPAAVAWQSWVGYGMSFAGFLIYALGKDIAKEKAAAEEKKTK